MDFISYISAQQFFSKIDMGCRKLFSKYLFIHVFQTNNDLIFFFSSFILYFSFSQVVHRCFRMMFSSSRSIPTSVSLLSLMLMRSLMKSIRHLSPGGTGLNCSFSTSMQSGVDGTALHSSIMFLKLEPVVLRESALNILYALLSTPFRDADSLSVKPKNLFIRACLM